MRTRATAGALGLLLLVGGIGCKGTLSGDGTDGTADQASPDITGETTLDDQQIEDPITGGEDCVSNERFFVRYVWTETMQSNCLNCHSPQGTARDTDFVLQFPDGFADALERNRLTAESVAKQRLVDYDNESAIIAKPLAIAPHGGEQVITEGSREHDILVEFVSRTENPVTCEDTGPTETADFFEGTEFFTPYETLRKSTLLLAGRLPTDAEIEAVDDGGIDALRPILDRVMQEDAFVNRVGEGMNDVLLTDAQTDTNIEGMLDRDHYPNRTWFDDIADNGMRNRARQDTRHGLGSSPVELIKHILKEDLPMSEVLTADYVMVNPMSARSYGVFDEIEWTDPEDRNEFRPVQLAATPDVEGDTYPHAGIRDRREMPRRSASSRRVLDLFADSSDDLR